MFSACSIEERTRLNDKLDLENARCVEWLSTDWEHYFTKKNVNSQPHVLLLSGLLHPGGAHTRGLRIGKDGNKTAGRMTSGQTRGHR